MATITLIVEIEGLSMDHAMEIARPNNWPISETVAQEAARAQGQDVTVRILGSRMCDDPYVWTTPERSEELFFLGKRIICTMR